MVSIAKIEELLSKAGALHIGKSYDAKTRELTGILFQVVVADRPLTFKLPAKVDQVEKMMMSNILKPRPGTRQRVREQANRTAWKLLYDWVFVQVSLIKLEQAELTEVFLPYLYNGATDQTYYAMLKEGGFKQLPMASQSK